MWQLVPKVFSLQKSLLKTDVSEDEEEESKFACMVAAEFLNQGLGE